ncbi:MAG: T9SS type A sorting domain-containing protein [Bacteroidales bacterium]
MKKLLTICTSLLLSTSMFATIVVGTVGNGNFIDWQNVSTPAFGLDFNNDGVLEFKLSNSGFDIENINCYIEYNASSPINNIWAIGTEDENWDIPKNLTLNTQIGTSGNWVGMGDCSLTNWTDDSPVFAVGTVSYMGFRFKLGSNTHYGWAKVVISGTPTTGYTATFQKIAYESTPNTPIGAGQGALGLSSIKTNNLSIYPNPATNMININGSENTSKIVISNILGEKTMEINSPSNSINIESLKPGVYFLTLYDGEKTSTKKLIKK